MYIHFIGSLLTIGKIDTSSVERNMKNVYVYSKTATTTKQYCNII